MKAQTLVFIGLFAAACGGKGNTGSTASSAEFVEAAPDVDALTLDESSSDTASGATREVTLPESSIAANVKTAVQDLNEGFKKILAEVKTMTAKEPTSSGEGSRVWQASKAGISYQLTIVRKAAGLFGWKMEAKKDADAAYVTVMVGHINKDKAGTIGLDLTAYKGVAGDAFTKEGKIFAAFRHNAAGAHLLYRLKDFKRDTTSTDEAISAYFSGYRLFKNKLTPAMGFVRAGGKFNVAQFDDLKDAPNETVTARLRRLVGVGGWGRAIIRGGNLPEGTRRVVRECWKAPEEGAETIYLRQVWNCTGSFDRATKTYPTCTLASTYPAGTMTDENPESQKTRGAFLAQCFPDATAAARMRLAAIAAEEANPSEDPADADDMDETPVNAYPGEQENPANVDTADANAIDSAASIDSLQ